MNRINIGTKVSPLGIPKCKLSANQIARAVLIDPNPMYKYIAYDEALKVRVEVDQDAVINYGLRPTTTYFYLIAVLNTDRMGNVVPGPVEVQYLQVSENVNNDFADAIRNMSNFSSLQLNAVEKVTQRGSFSYVKPIPCDTIQLPQDVIEQVNRFRTTPGAIDAMWKIIDASTSITVQAYQQLLAQEANKTQLPPPTANPPIPQAPYSPMLGAGTGYAAQPAPVYSKPAQPTQPTAQPLPIQPTTVSQAQPAQAPVDNDFNVGEEFNSEGFDK